MTHRYAHIDALRAVAVPLVIWMHTSEVLVPIALSSVQSRLHKVAHFFDFGRIGVVVFFHHQRLRDSGVSARPPRRGLSAIPDSAVSLVLAVDTLRFGDHLVDVGQDDYTAGDSLEPEHGAGGGERISATEDQLASTVCMSKRSPASSGRKFSGSRGSE